MISVGIDVSKEKSTICILSSPFEINHTEKELSEVSSMLKRFDDEVRIVMEATGGYHFPILQYLVEQNLYVCVVNPLLINMQVQF